ncbi:hypothetical protein BDV96DRAFT_605270 [Lophiotrema nucula]|uniref:Uncharacterized protein n=1 Tax=Lophiotrema nucula TaxID=690887 RepID=A0A6A5YPF9_9PLEO|nr:hypothetical protein BDV96DRAFT_605270 [Lophiotrema nucula]
MDAKALDEWLRSVLGPSIPLVEHNWIDNPFDKRDSPADWVTTRPEADVDSFYHVALGVFLDKAHSAILYSSHVIGDVVSRDWLDDWNDVVRRVAKIFDGYPVLEYPLKIRSEKDESGSLVVNWDVPYRWSVQTDFRSNLSNVCSCLDLEGGLVHGFNWSCSNVRLWGLQVDQCLIANSTWKEVVINKATFVRCTFRNTTFENVQFLSCAFTDVDFSDLFISNSLISYTTLLQTKIRETSLESVSWCSNRFTRSLLDGILLHKSIWTYIVYSGMEVKDHHEYENSESYIVSLN